MALAQFLCGWGQGTGPRLAPRRNQGSRAGGSVQQKLGLPQPLPGKGQPQAPKTPLRDQPSRRLLSLFSPPPPQKIRQGTDLPTQRCPAGVGRRQGGRPPQPGLDRGEFPNPPEDPPPLPTVVRGGAGPLRRAGRRLPFLWVGSSPAAQPPTRPPQAAEISPGCKKEQRVYLHAPAFRPLGS